MDRRAECVTIPPAVSAELAGLCYIGDDAPGIRRQRAGNGFVYRDACGRRISDRVQLDRLRRLAIPPAWRNVWISPDPRGHLQATGRDAKGRKQHLYHPDWHKVRDEAKFGRMQEFGRALPGIRAAVERDIQGEPRGPAHGAGDHRAPAGNNPRARRQ